MTRSPFHRPQSAPQHAVVPYGDTWRDHAICRDHPRLKPEAWDDSVMNDGGDYLNHRAERVTAARAVCLAECPVRLQCLADVDLEWDDGVRGGVDLRELKRRRKTVQ
jgi:hypothetical protein